MQQKARNKKERGQKIRDIYRKRQRNSSIFFFVWSVFTAFTVFIALVFGVTQQVLFSQTYRREAFRELTKKGDSIEREIGELPPPTQFAGDYSSFIRYLSSLHEVDVLLLNTQGEVVYPEDLKTDPDRAEYYENAVKEITKKMQEEATRFVLFEGEDSYVYASKIALGDGEGYLYIGKSLQIMKTSVSQMGVRMTLVSIFIIVLSFAISSAVSGWLTKPLSEMTGKAKRLAKGDFEVDFHGANYGEEMVELAETLNFARDELAKTDRMQKELIANVSHDFKTPLTMIKAYASMIQEISGDIPEKRDKHAQVIIDEADRLATLVSDVLDLSKLQSGMDSIKETVFDMSAYMIEILDRFAYLKDTQGYQFIVDVEEDLYTKGDEVKIGQVLYNLIGNAVNYTGENKKVYVRLKKRTQNSFRFEVRDTGAGIKQEELSAVWDRYYRSSESHKRPVKGMGLGLSIVKTILQKHGFAFGVESKIGRGSTFYVDFPYVAEEDEKKV